jgi:hypothetical protein
LNYSKSKGFLFEVKEVFYEGKLVELWGVGDMLTLMQQLGMEFKPMEGRGD